MDILTINLNSNSNIPLYIQLYKFIKHEIQMGNMKSNSKLPSKRKLSHYLAISQNTVEAAYEQLMTEGYIISFPRKGYFVSDLQGILEVNIEKEAVNEKLKKKKIYQYEFYSSRVDVESFPYSIWRKINKEILGEENKELLQIGHSQGDRNLREAINNYLRFSRGVNAKIDNIIIGAGTEYLIQIIINILGRNKRFSVEEPGYYKIKKILKINGVNPIPISIDNQGVNVDRLRESNSEVIHITPSHQFPTGIIMPINRRIQILNWANESKGRYIIEDDYDSEFRFEGKPIPALQSLDNKGKVIYLGTFSKCFSPSERIAYMVLPDELMKIYRKDFSFLACTVSRSSQQALVRFIEEGYFERHLNKMRNIYRKKREFLVTLIKKYLNNTEIIGTNSGLHLLLKVNNGMNEEELIKSAEEKGVMVLGLSKSYLNNIEESKTVFLGYANLKYNEIEEAIKLLKEAWNL
ncbi:MULTISPECIES: PLP-dependent aminotransferase family protein [unclassified Clostridium]|uniref:MocR-like pyridoxine biosynthesis transcription factor PdxR n=1 Tax=unclassified Clostridium TaxID=2614128 RepID=UPI0025C60677|nr:PLP-dependent aminotransferase family protein [Clostridium sp.]MCI6693989.1 PLP-dependent aminotransferase family protein [Clostridium sp.]MDY2632555.1 PLP-dependent aminotransferase family protein [Clostridium sp.]MDY4253021.1 PLP-dependent aminotransferase family protein [Clostridium sp.]MDY6228639.1 PLP-dependent aminotransferase family protein [Clostridium sp.]